GSSRPRTRASWKPASPARGSWSCRERATSSRSSARRRPSASSSRTSCGGQRARRERLDIIASIGYVDAVRTTLQIDDDVLAIAKAQAEARGVSLGKALSELARKGARAEMPVKSVSGLKVF